MVERGACGSQGTGGSLKAPSPSPDERVLVGIDVLCLLAVLAANSDVALTTQEAVQ